MTLTSFMLNHHAAGTAPDTVPITIELEPPAMRFDLGIFDNSALVSFSADKIYYTTEREFPAGIFVSLDQWVHAFRIRNKTPGSPARFDFAAYYNPVEIVGQDAEPLLKH